MASNIGLKEKAEGKKVIHAETLKLAAHPNTVIRTVRWRNLPISVRPLLTFRETSCFVNTVMAACFDDEHGIAVPEAMDFAIRANTVLRYTNLELPEDLEEQYTVLYGTDIYDTIRQNIQTAQLDAIIKTIELCMQRMK